MRGKGIDTPFIPESNVVAAVVDGRISFEVENNLRNSGIHIIKTPFCSALYPAISCHPDILLHPIASNRIILSPNIYDAMKCFFEKLGIEVIKGSSVLMRNYPNNIAYNIGRVGKLAIHNLNYTDKVILKLLEENEVELIHVKQGYSKCSISVVNDHAIITSDRGIAKALEKKGIDVLCITPGFINLPGLNYGFIGGATGLIAKNRLAFTGNIQYHPDYEKINTFLIYHKVEPVFLANDILVDFGSIIPLLEMEY